MNVGFIGLGRMGTPMALSLLRAGFPLTVYNRTQQGALPLRDAGATVAESPVEVAASADVVITMLSDAGAVAEVANGQAGIPNSVGTWFPIGLVLALALYFVWALVEQHQKVKSAIRPANVGINLRNIAVITITVVLMLNVFKIVSAKFVAWGVPGARSAP